MVHCDTDVAEVVRAMWQPDADRTTAFAALAEYGVEAHEREVPRVRLAILKLSSGQIERLPDLVSQAKRDYRDVLMWAEYPEEGRSAWIPSARMSPEQHRLLAGIRQRDREQYAGWLTELRRRRTGG